MGKPVTVTYQDSANNTQVLRFDATMSQRHNLSQTITDSPIERGANVSDHATPDLDVVTLSVIISNQPVRADADPSGRLQKFKQPFPRYEPPLAPTVGSVTNSAREAINSLLSNKGQLEFEVLTFDELNRPRQFYESFKFLRDNSLLCRVLTSMRDYEDMEVLEVAGLRDDSTGDSASFELTFRQMNLATTQTGAVRINTSELRAFKQKNNGSKATKKPENETANKSILASSLDSLS